jgi:hypothetical protein
MGCFPGQKKCLLHFLTVLRLAMTLDRWLVALPVIEKLDGMFARVTRPLHKRIQEQGFLG